MALDKMLRDYKMWSIFLVVCVALIQSTDAVENCTREASPCKNGVMLPMWTPAGNLSAGDKAARATVYFAAMAFMFLGVSIIADRFMAAIEVITSKEKEVIIRKPDGETHVLNVRVWNETVSNLTLMALGSSAPEILLSVIEVIGNNFEAGDLGPSTIVGSAAFNLFVIIAICVYVIPDGEVRRIKHLRVFFITATWSVFAYLWMYLIIAVITPGQIDVWEGILTFLYFPLTVLTAYIADKRIFFYKFMTKRYRATKRKTVVVTEGGDMEMNKAGDMADPSDNPEVMEFEKQRKEYMDVIRDLRKKNPNIDIKQLEEQAQYEIMNRGPKSRAFYRIQATRKLTGSGNVIKKSKIEKSASLEDVKVEVAEDLITKIFFEPGHYTVMENIGTFNATVSREGGDLNNTIYVDYRTENGTASAGTDYEFAEGTLVFNPGETHKQFPISIIDDDIFEEDEHFYIRLSNIRVGGPDGMFSNSATEAKAQLANPSLATVMILDDDHGGIFHFENPELDVVESIGEAHIKLVRSSGARGKVRVPYHTIDGTAKDGVDFIAESGELEFENDQNEGWIPVRIIDDEQYEKNENFFIQLGEPYHVTKGADEKKTDEEKSDEDLDEEARIAKLGKPILGKIPGISIHIRESKEFKSTVDKLLKKTNMSIMVGTASWKEQFVEAITVQAGDEDDDEEGGEDAEEKLPSCMDYVMHFLTIFWKILFAFVPPTDVAGGWACFWVSIIMIGVLTGIIGDIASGFGCIVGLKDSVTAISFVALGTSVPDTFASKVAAIGDPYADSSIGNVTGSNAVNVFLGIGIAWTVAAIKHAIYGTKFQVVPGALGFSVTVFCVFAFLAIMMILARRRPWAGGELGGTVKYKLPTTLFLVGLWVSYVILSALQDYCYIPGF